MAKKAAIAVIIGLGVGIGGIALFATRAKAAEPPEVVIPTPDDIMAASTMGELEVYYMYIGELFITGKIDRETYEGLYDAYVARYYELTGRQ
ncbi:unnamed protein product [marine sediment metagenome]|uniref:Uncharacterized protein n=1 Tax=marine sediment metagenome TaxID=412755 RepID=X1QHZ9_9ZZZZ